MRGVRFLLDITVKKKSSKGGGTRYHAKENFKTTPSYSQENRITTICRPNLKGVCLEKNEGISSTIHHRKKAT